MRERISRRSQGFESLHNQNGKQRRSPFAPRPFPENTDAPDSAEPAYQQNFAANSSSSMSDIPLFPPGKEDKNGETQLEPHIRAKVLGGESMENPPQVKQPNQTSDHNISKLKQEKSAGMIAPLGAITFGPIAIKIIGFTLLIFWLNNGGWEQIGEVTNFISQGITKTIDDIRNIISNVSQTAIERVNEIETYLAEYVFFAKGIRTNHSEDREFKKAIKKIEQIIGRKLNEEERQILHQEITGQHYTVWEIIITGVELFGTPEDLEKIPRSKWPPEWHPDDI